MTGNHLHRRRRGFDFTEIELKPPRDQSHCIHPRHSIGQVAFHNKLILKSMTVYWKCYENNQHLSFIQILKPYMLGKQKRNFSFAGLKDTSNASGKCPAGKKIDSESSLFLRGCSGGGCEIDEVPLTFFH